MPSALIYSNCDHARMMQIGVVGDGGMVEPYSPDQECQVIQRPICRVGTDLESYGIALV